MVLQHLDPGIGGNGLQQGPLDLSAREIGRVNDSPHGVAGFTSQREPLPLLAEASTPLHELANALRSFPDQFIDRPTMA